MHFRCCVCVCCMYACKCMCVCVRMFKCPMECARRDDTKRALDLASGWNLPKETSDHMAPAQGPCGLMDKALVFGTKDCRFESCQGHFATGIQCAASGGLEMQRPLQPMRGYPGVRLSPLTGSATPSGLSKCLNHNVPILMW